VIPAPEEATPARRPLVRRAALWLLALAGAGAAALALSAALAGPAAAAPAPTAPAAPGAAAVLVHGGAREPGAGWASLRGAAAPVTRPVPGAVQAVVGRGADAVPPPVRRAAARALVPATGPVATLAPGAAGAAGALGTLVPSPPGLSAVLLGAAPLPAGESVNPARAPLASGGPAPARGAAHEAGDAPSAPSPVPDPERRAPQPVPDPLSLPAGTATGDGLSPGHGGTPLEALPPTTLLLPALVLAGLVFVRRSELALAFELRYVPPG